MLRGTRPDGYALPPQGEFQRWTAKRKAAVVLELLRGKTTAAEVARAQGLTVAEVDQWKDRFLTSAEDGLRTNPRETTEAFDAERKQLLAKIGELVASGYRPRVTSNSRQCTRMRIWTLGNQIRPHPVRVE